MIKAFFLPFERIKNRKIKKKVSYSILVSKKKYPNTPISEPKVTLGVFPVLFSLISVSK